MRDVAHSISRKFIEAVEIFLASRLCSNSLRGRLLRTQGWLIGEGSIVRWGLDFTTKKVTIGSASFIGRHGFIDGCGTLTIGNNVRIGPHVKILTTTHPIESAIIRRTFGVDFDLDTRIEHGCWLGTGVVILPGITIAQGCVIAAGALIASDTEENGLYSGVPARRMKDLQVN
jgi:maltose O-acetyltransferase